MYLSLSYTEAAGSQVNPLLFDSKRMNRIIFLQENSVRALKTKMSTEPPHRQELHCGRASVGGLSNSVMFPAPEGM